MHNFYKNKRVLITGGTGSLGKALITKLKDYDYRAIVDPSLLGEQGNIEFYSAGTSPNPKGLAMSLKDTKDLIFSK